jgi:hypothetical protein
MSNNDTNKNINADTATATASATTTTTATTTATATTTTTTDKESLTHFTNDYINRVTLEYLLNKEQYNTLMRTNPVKNTNKKDVKFYKKRIFNLTKELLTTSDKPDMLPPDVRRAFETYTHYCIQYFKIIDNNDILQADYNSIEIEKDDDSNTIDFKETQQEADKLLMRSIQISNNSLDTFVKKKSTKKSNIILPHKKDVNLKDPVLKIKGIPKKNNIINKYGENKDDEETKKDDEPKNNQNESENKK